MSADELMKHTYINFPYWATKSVKAESLLSETEMSKVKESVLDYSNTVLFTIGYEGLSLEEYLNRLIMNDIHLLIDVRKNPLSMKYGFSKTKLKSYCESIEIKYLHIPELGIESGQRQELNEQVDYDKLFGVYRKNNLSKTLSKQEEILILLGRHKRIALTCFEANIHQCHRKHLAEAIANLPDFEYEVKHI
jgi:uncharacterized protein (DUF488 family)